ncbi:hypothetical protein HanRHA438_Chr01g0021791 [Helianthus annuus]|nr:hypothetical protein HanRHA438_Chr01g0021791 [Helianthus annuus]
MLYNILLQSLWALTFYRSQTDWILTSNLIQKVENYERLDANFVSNNTNMKR